MKSIEELQKLVVQGFTNWEKYGHVNVKEKDGLILFNYGVLAQVEASWTWFERVSRGLIINKNTGEIVARPYDKFFNWNETHVPKPNRRNRQIVSITEKMDGSLGILHRNDVEGYKISTRGSFDSEQSIIATEMLNTRYGNNLHEIPYECTLLFEIIYPENRIVVDYGDRQALVLIGARNRFTGEHYDLDFRNDMADYFGFETPRDYNTLIPDSNRSIDYIMSYIKDWTSNQEGLVVEFNNGSFWKFKSPEYCRVHKFLSSINFKNILEAVKDGSIDDILTLVPEHFEEEVNAIVEDIRTTIINLITEIEEKFQLSPKESRKEFAQWVMSRYPELQSYLFARFDEKDLLPVIYKNAFKNRNNKHLICNN